MKTNFDQQFLAGYVLDSSAGCFAGFSKSQTREMFVFAVLHRSN